MWVLAASSTLETCLHTHSRAPSPTPPALHTQVGSHSLLKNAEINSPRKSSSSVRKWKSVMDWRWLPWVTGPRILGKEQEREPGEGEGLVSLTKTSARDSPGWKGPFSSGSVAIMHLGWARGKEPICQCRRCKRCRFDPWVRKITWRRTWQPTLGYSPYGCKESDRLKQLSTCACMGVVVLCCMLAESMMEWKPWITRGSRAIERRETEKRSRGTDRKRKWFSFRAFLFSDNS